MKIRFTGFCFVLIISACGGTTTVDTSTNNQDSSAAQTTSSVVTPDATDTPPPTKPPPPIPTTTSTTAPETGSSTDPLPVGEDSTFTYSDSSTEWDGVVLGLVETELHEWNDEAGTCLVLIGILTAVSNEDGVVTSGFSTPEITLVTEGRLNDGSVLDCDVNDIESLGYGWILDAEVTEGTSYPFYTEFFLPEGEEQLDLIILGPPSSNDSVYYAPTKLNEIPPSTATIGPDPKTSREVLPIGDESPFIYESFGTEWVGVVDGLVETELHEWNDRAGTCLVLIGEMTPTIINEGIVTSGFDTPDVSIIVDGKLNYGGFSDCDTSILESFGYGWIVDAEVTVGTAYLFYSEFFIPEGNGQVELVILGPAYYDADALYYDPIIIAGA